MPAPRDCCPSAVDASVAEAMSVSDFRAIVIGMCELHNAQVYLQRLLKASIECIAGGAATIAPLPSATHVMRQGAGISNVEARPRGAPTRHR